MDKKDLYVWVVKNGSKKPKKIKLKKLIDTLNLELFTKKFFVYVKAGSKVKKVSFGSKTMKIRKNNKAARKSFLARHRCSNAGPKTKARYWSCKMWR